MPILAQNSSPEFFLKVILFSHSTTTPLQLKGSNILLLLKFIHKFALFWTLEIYIINTC